MASGGYDDATDEAEGELCCVKLDQMINVELELVQLAGKIKWPWLDRAVALLYSGEGRPGLSPGS